MWDLISDLKALKENSVKFLSSRIWLFDALKRTQKIIPKRLLNKGIKKHRLKFNLGLALPPSNNWAFMFSCMHDFIGCFETKTFAYPYLPHKLNKSHTNVLVISRCKTLPAGKCWVSCNILIHDNSEQWCRSKRVTLYFVSIKFKVWKNPAS